MTRLIGRESGNAATDSLLSLDEVRLITLVGPRGSGKTRLALEMATHLRHVFTHGVYCVALAVCVQCRPVPRAFGLDAGAEICTRMSLLHTFDPLLAGPTLLLPSSNFDI